MATKTIEATQTGDKIAVRGDQSLATIPEHLKQYIGDKSGSEGVGQDDIIIPRLGLAQAGMSAQLKKHHESFIPGLKEGDLFNTLTREVYGETVVVVPLMFNKQYIKFKSMKDGGGVVQMYASKADVPPAELEFNPLVNEGKPLVTEFKNRVCLIIHQDRKPELVIVSFKSSGLKEARYWNSLITSTNLPAFARSYELKSTVKIDGDKSWNILKVSPLEFVPEDFFNAAKAYFDQLQDKGFKVDTTGIEDESGASSEAAPF